MFYCRDTNSMGMWESGGLLSNWKVRLFETRERENPCVRGDLEPSIVEVKKSGCNWYLLNRWSWLQKAGTPRADP